MPVIVTVFIKCKHQVSMDLRVERRASACPGRGRRAAKNGVKAMKVKPAMPAASAYNGMLLPANEQP